jgi:hypothetical protein
MVSLFYVVIESADFKFVASLFIALDTFILIRMIKAFNHSVALLTL